MFPNFCNQTFSGRNFIWLSAVPWPCTTRTGRNLHICMMAAFLERQHSCFTTKVSWVAEMEVVNYLWTLSDPQPSLNYVAVEETVLLVLTRSDFMKVLAESPDILSDMRNRLKENSQAPENRDFAEVWELFRSFRVFSSKFIKIGSELLHCVIFEKFCSQRTYDCLKCQEKWLQLNLLPLNCGKSFLKAFVEAFYIQSSNRDIFSNLHNVVKLQRTNHCSFDKNK